MFILNLKYLQNSLSLSLSLCVYVYVFTMSTDLSSSDINWLLGKAHMVPSGMQCTFYFGGMLMSFFSEKVYHPRLFAWILNVDWGHHTALLLGSTISSLLQISADPWYPAAIHLTLSTFVPILHGGHFQPSPSSNLCSHHFLLIFNRWHRVLLLRK